VGGKVKKEYVLISLIICISLLFPQTIYSDVIPASQSLITTSDDLLYTWHDSCTNTSGWLAQSEISGFSIEGNITYGYNGLQTTSNGLTVPSISLQSLPSYGYLFIKNLPSGIMMYELQDLRIMMQCAFELGETGSMKVYLYDDQKQIIFILGISDSDAYSLRFTPLILYLPLAGNYWFSYDSKIASSWEDYFRIWYDSVNATYYSLIDHDGDIEYREIVNRGEVELDREVKYIGISWTRFYDETYSGARLELCDIQLTYSNIESPSEPDPTNYTLVTEIPTTSTPTHPHTTTPPSFSDTTAPSDTSTSEELTPQFNPAIVAVSFGSMLVIIIYTLKIISFKKNQ